MAQFQSYEAIYLNISDNPFGLTFNSSAFSFSNSINYNDTNHLYIDIHLTRTHILPLDTPPAFNRLQTLNASNDGCGLLQPLPVRVRLVSPTVGRFFMPHCAAGIWEVEYVFPSNQYAIKTSFYALESSLRVKELPHWQDF